MFRNSRVIGRRFKLAHVFFGPKIIETSTFRAPPQSTDSDDPLITQDNEWGSVEDDARRRDFTVNGLFFDVEVEKIVDFVDGLDDLEGRLIRTIGDPLLRFQEDPVRMIRAVKFAARLDFDIEPETWNALLEVASDVAKCSQARVLEEIYKLLRGGASRRSFALMLETGLLEALMPDYVRLYGDDVESGIAALEAAAEADDDEDDTDDVDDEELDEASPLSSARSPARLLWRYLGALDEYTTATRQVAVNGVLQAVLFAPLLSGDLSSSSRADLDRKIDGLMTPVGAALGIARRDRELARQILMAHRRMVDPRRRRGRPSIAGRQYFHDALIFLGISVGATGDGGSELTRWKRLAAAQRKARQADQPRGTKKRRRRGGRTKRGRKSGGEPAAKAAEG